MAADVAVVLGDAEADGLPVGALVDGGGGADELAGAEVLASTLVSGTLRVTVWVTTEVSIEGWPPNRLVVTLAFAAACLELAVRLGCALLGAAAVELT